MQEQRSWPVSFAFDTFIQKQDGSKDTFIQKQDGSKERVRAVWVRVWIESNKLTKYFQEFIDKGYDDLEEITQILVNLLDELATDVSIAEKPNHLCRFKTKVQSLTRKAWKRSNLSHLQRMTNHPYQRVSFYICQSSIYVVKFMINFINIQSQYDFEYSGHSNSWHWLPPANKLISKIIVLRIVSSS